MSFADIVRRGTDARYRWMQAALDQIFDELEPGEMPGSVAVQIATIHSELLCYAVTIAKPGEVTKVAYGPASFEAARAYHQDHLTNLAAPDDADLAGPAGG